MATDSRSHTVLFTQIVATGVSNNAATQCNWVLFGLDHSGRVWKRTDQHEWERVEHPALLTDEQQAGGDKTGPGPQSACFGDIKCEAEGDFIEINDLSVYAGRPLKLTIEEAQCVRDWLIEVTR